MSEQFPIVEYIDLPNRTVVLEGFTLPITNMFDAEGDETDDHDQVVVVVAGADDYWLTVEVYPDSHTVN